MIDTVIPFCSVCVLNLVWFLFYFREEYYRIQGGRYYVSDDSGSGSDNDITTRRYAPSESDGSGGSTGIIFVNYQLILLKNIFLEIITSSSIIITAS